MKYALVGALFAVAAPAISAADAQACFSVHTVTTKAVNESPSTVLATVAKLVAANENCACEVVKAAIIASEANKELVGQIVETAINASPKQLEQITKCAVAVAPDAHREIVAVVENFDTTAQGREKVSPILNVRGPLLPASVKNAGTPGLFGAGLPVNTTPAASRTTTVLPVTP